MLDIELVEGESPIKTETILQGIVSDPLRRKEFTFTEKPEVVKFDFRQDPIYGKIIHYTGEQRSEEWFKARLGRITGSWFDRLMPTDSQKITTFTDTQKKYLKEKAVEKIIGEQEQGYSSKYMEEGSEKEPQAKKYYELENYVVIQDVGFYQFGDNFGDSPDGITDDRCIEIKCPKSTTHLDYLLDPKKLLKNYQWQCYGHMIATGLRQCDLFSFDPRFPDDKKMVVVNIQFEQDKADLLMQRLELANQKLKEFLR